MNKIAYIYDGFVINWSAIIIVLAVVSAVLVCFALAVRKPGYATAVAVTLPVSMVLGCIFARIIHWYCRTDQYESFAQAFTDFTVGGFSLIGVVLGVLLAACVVWAIGLAPSLGKLLDILAPGAAVGIGLGRLSFLFSYADRGKVFIENEANRRLPIGSAVINVSSGAVEWRFATFFVQALIAAVIFLIILCFFFRFLRRERRSGADSAGMNFFLFMILYFTSEIIMDSTRYDALFLRSNGFVSLMQIFGAVIIVLSFVYLCVNAVRYNGFKKWYIIVWVIYLGSLGLAGYMEYYVQRHGNLYMLSYSLMASGLLLSILCACVMMKCNLKKKSA